MDEKNTNIKELTKAEEQVMQILWDIRKGFVKDILAKMPEPKPAYNTVSTIVRILEKKEFVSYKAYGKTHEYFPLVERDEYRSFSLGSLMKNYFGGKIEKMVSFFARENNMDANELERLIYFVQQDIDKEESKKDDDERSS